MKISVIGDHNTVVGFKLGGVNEGIEVENPKAALAAIKELLKDKDAGLIIITERLLKPISDEVERITEKRLTPLIIAIPDSKGFREERVDIIKKIIKRTIGIEIKY